MATPRPSAGTAELFRALGALSETPRRELQEIADLLDLGALPTRAAHSSLFLLQLYPYAAVYLGAEGMMGGEAEDRVAGFWRALGQTPPPQPDHLALMLGLYARLGELEEEAAPGAARESWRHSRRAFLWEHLLSWLPLFLAKLSELDGLADPFYLRWADLLRATLREEAETLLRAPRAPRTPRAPRAPQTLQAPLAPQPPRLQPLHLRAAPGLADPRRDGAEVFLASLLSPVRSGMILVGADLARATRELGLGPRLGERRAILKTMLEQDAAAALGWLGEEATAWAGKHRPEVHFAPDLAAFWQQRAEATARLANDLAAEV
jgi:TorA maturation chaperone TorD